MVASASRAWPQAISASTSLGTSKTSTRPRSVHVYDSAGVPESSADAIRCMARPSSTTGQSQCASSRDQSNAGDR
jgi:hypothetical protein